MIEHIIDVLKFINRNKQPVKIKVLIIVFIYGIYLFYPSKIELKNDPTADDLYLYISENENNERGYFWNYIYNNYFKFNEYNVYIGCAHQFSAILKLVGCNISIDDNKIYNVQYPNSIFIGRWKLGERHKVDVALIADYASTDYLPQIKNIFVENEYYFYARKDWREFALRFGIFYFSILVLISTIDSITTWTRKKYWFGDSKYN